MACRTAILVVFVAYGFSVALCPAAEPPLPLLMFDGGSVARLSINGGTATSTTVLKNVGFFQALPNGRFVSCDKDFLLESGARWFVGDVAAPDAVAEVHPPGGANVQNSSILFGTSAPGGRGFDAIRRGTDRHLGGAAAIRGRDRLCGFRWRAEAQSARKSSQGVPRRPEWILRISDENAVWFLGQVRAPDRLRKLIPPTQERAASRKNIPTAEYQSVMKQEQQSPLPVAYERRNGDLDPQPV